MKRPCLEPGCPALVDQGTRCPQHERAYDLRRGTANERGYSTPEHRAWARAVLSRDRICRICRRAPAKVADHILAVALGGEKWSLANGQGVCKSCHSRKTLEEQRRTGRLGPASSSSATGCANPVFFQAPPSVAAQRPAAVPPESPDFFSQPGGFCRYDAKERAAGVHLEDRDGGAAA